MKLSKSLLNLITMTVVCCMMFSLTGCSLFDNMDKDKVLDTYNDIISSAGKSLLTKNLSLKGNRKFGTDKYVGTYSSDYKDFSGSEYLFGGTFIERETGKNITITCTFDIKDGTAQLFWLCGADNPVVLLEGTGEYSETIELPEGGNYIGITGDNLTGSVELTIADVETESD